LGKEAITEFRGKYAFLSNFYEVPVFFEGLMYRNNEAAFQSAKILGRSKRMIFCGMEPSPAKQLGRRLRLREDWENVKTAIMEEIVLDKFTRNPKCGEKLLDTGNALLVEGNTWNDTFWVVCNGTGENRLGILLMKIRDEL
jgi:ribA/ribD-fused uncharacterized protein